MERSYIADIRSGRKKGVRGENLERLARALECDAEYLTGQQDEPRKSGVIGLTIAGIIEAGVWRTPGSIRHRPPAIAPLLPDPRFPGVQHSAWEFRGGGAELLGIADGWIVVTIDPEQAHIPIRHGTVCLIRRTRQDRGETETSIRQTIETPEGIRFAAPTDDDDFPDLAPGEHDGERVEVAGVVDRAVRLFL